MTAVGFCEFENSKFMRSLENVRYKYENVQNKEGIGDQKSELRRTLTSSCEVKMNQGYVFKTKNFQNYTIPSQFKVQSHKNLGHETQDQYRTFAALGYN